MSTHINIVKKPEPFDSFEMVFKLLIWQGCQKLLDTSNHFKLYYHNMYRIIYFATLLIMNTFQITFMIFSAKDENTMLEVMVIEIPLMNTIMKVLTLFLRSARIEKLREVMSGPYFAAKGPKDEEYLNQNTIGMERLLKFMMVNVVVVVLSWYVSHFVRKMQGEHVPVPMYVPFETESWLGFFILVTLRVGLTGYLGFSNVTIDSLIGIYYSQSIVQLKILKYNLEHMFDKEEDDRATSDSQTFMYRDMIDNKLRKRFIYYNNRYETIVWFTKEINSVFNWAITFQFFTAAITICFVIYNMTKIPTLSAQFMFLVTLIIIFQFEVFVYCHFGSRVEYEQQSVCQSAFHSDWITLSPSFRRSLLIAMTRWTQPLRTRVSVVIPLSINTSIQVLRSAYTMFTLMSKTGK